MDWLVKEGYDPVYGARPLRRALQRYIENPLAKKLLAGELTQGDNIVVDVKKNSLTFTQVIEITDSSSGVNSTNTN